MNANLDQLERLSTLYEKGSITEDEFLKEKENLLNQNSKSTKSELLGINESTYCMLIHLSVFAGFMHFALTFIAPIVLWILNKDTNEKVNANGKNLINWLLSFSIYMTIFIAVFLGSGFSGNFSISLLPDFPMGMPSLTNLMPITLIYIANLAFIVAAAIKANNGKVWKYPLAINFIK